MTNRFFPGRIAAIALAGFFVAGITAAMAQEMPAPHKMPRTPVGSEPLPDNKPAPPSREVSGPAAIIDGEKLRVGELDLRLFGVIPPQLSASFGPQARAALDNLTAGQNVDCRIRDRDHDGRFLATCHTETTKADLALELLRRGLAVTARGSLQPTELAPTYLAAEEAAQAQKTGLWSVAQPAAAVTLSAATALAPSARVGNNPPPPTPAEAKAPEKSAIVVASSAPPTVISLGPGTPQAPSASVAPAPTVVPVAVPAPTLAEDVQKALPPGNWSLPAEDLAPREGFFARYQFLITALILLATAIGVLGTITINRRRERIEEMKAVAAALRGELQAARAVGQARLKSWSEADDKNVSWPRIRTSLYQAYVGRLGMLGAALARQIASIYGQASDYSSYYNTPGAENGAQPAPKRQALQTLIRHIEEVLPRLATIEQTGLRPKADDAFRPQDSIIGAAAPASHRAPSPEAQRASAEMALANVAAPLAPFWNRVRKLAEALPASTAWRPAADASGDPETPDYTTLIEEEIASLSFRMEEEIAAEPPLTTNVTKLRGTGS